MEQGATNSSQPEEKTSTMDCSQALEEFITTGRTGRRNAMPDILDSQHASTGTGSLACGMEKLNCSDTSQTGEAAQSTASTSTSKGS